MFFFKKLNWFSILNTEAANTVWLNPILTTDVMKLLSASLKDIQDTFDFAIYLIFFFTPLGVFLFLKQLLANRQCLIWQKAEIGQQWKKWHHQKECDHVIAEENWENMIF